MRNWLSSIKRWENILSKCIFFVWNWSSAGNLIQFPVQTIQIVLWTEPPIARKIKNWNLRENFSFHSLNHSSKLHALSGFALCQRYFDIENDMNVHLRGIASDCTILEWKHAHNWNYHPIKWTNERNYLPPFFVRRNYTPNKNPVTTPKQKAEIIICLVVECVSV